MAVQLFVLTCRVAVVLISLGHCLGSYDEELHAVLSPSLTDYVTLHPTSVNHTLHGRQSQPHHSRLVEFHALERHFQLYLKPHYRLFSPGFKVHSVDGKGNTQLHEIDRTEYYHGYMGGEENSIVTAHISKSGLMTATVRTNKETYHFEPSEDYVARPHPPHMIGYRASDVKSRDGGGGRKFDYVVAPPLPPDVQRETTTDHKQTVRRQTLGSISGSSCSMILVADGRFYDTFGGSGDKNENVLGITRRIITLVAEVDREIYRNTKWIIDNREIDGLGLEIARVLIHTELTDTSFVADATGYYNSRRCCGELVPGPLDADGLLTAFNFGGWDGYCLAHLFTFVDFDSGLLGLANIASTIRSQTGGICSEDFIDSSRQQRIIYNTGLSSFTSRGNPLIRDEQILVFAHEVGHNWGSHHDPGDEDNYLMNQFAQDGSEGNHRRFSDNSRVGIGQVLRNKATCFVVADSCGDYVMGESADGEKEECDEGPLGGACCTEQCQLREDATCSDINSPCCTNCIIAMATTVCNVAGPLTNDCRTDVTCDGENATCPDRNTTGMAPPGMECLLGVCTETDSNSNVTICVDYCVSANMERCMCAQDDECKLCCKMPGGQCEVFLDPQVFLPTGHGCSGGTCLGGECRAIQDTISRLFDIIVNLDVNELILFMEENIVGFTLIYSLILWVPAAVLLHCCYDRKVWKKFKRENVDFIRAIQPEKQPLIDHGELGSRDTSPIDDSPHPTYSSRLRSIPEEDSDDQESDSDTKPGLTRI